MENWTWQRHGSAGNDPPEPSNPSNPPDPRPATSGARTGPEAGPDAGPDAGDDTGPDAGDEDETTARDVRVAGAPKPDSTRPDSPIAEGEVATEFPPAGAHATAPRQGGEQLMDPAAAKRIQGRWRDIQAGFVEDPRDATRQADALAGEAINALTEALGTRRRSLAPDAGEPPDTELLRIALLAYRDLVERILRI